MPPSKLDEITNEIDTWRLTESGQGKPHQVIDETMDGERSDTPQRNIEQHFEKGFLRVENTEQQAIIQATFGAEFIQGKAYPNPLPTDLAVWLCYSPEHGFCIACLIEGHYDDRMLTISQYLHAVPVKAILREGWYIQQFPPFPHFMRYSGPRMPYVVMNHTYDPIKGPQLTPDFVSEDKEY